MKLIHTLMNEYVQRRKTMSPLFVRIYFLLVVTLFLIIDYFPNASVLSSIPGIAFFILLLIYLILGAIYKKKNIDKAALKTRIHTIFYVIVFGLICILFGDGSQGIIIFKHGVFFFSLCIALLELLRDYSFYKTNKQ